MSGPPAPHRPPTARIVVLWLALLLGLPAFVALVGIYLTVTFAGVVIGLFSQ